MDVGRDIGKELCSQAAVCAHGLAAHGLPAEQHSFSGVLGALCSSEKEGKRGCPTHRPAAQPFSQDSPCAVPAPGLCSPRSGGVQGMAWGRPLPTFQCCWGLGDARTPAAEDVEAAAFQASEAAASARVDSVMRSPSFSVNPSCSPVGAASLPPHPTVCAAECCSLWSPSEAPGGARAPGAGEEAAQRCTGTEHPRSAAPRTLTHD